MQRVWLYDPPAPEGARLPTEDELPSSDGRRMETQRHILQMILLLETLSRAWKDRLDTFMAGNMFVYFSPSQVMNQDFRGPDVFVATGVSPRERKSWVVWQEGKPPDLVIELMSDGTADVDRGPKKRIYQDRLVVPEYVWFDPFSGELAGWRLRRGVYESIQEEKDGGITCESIGVRLVPWIGSFQGVDAGWLRWTAMNGTLLPTGAEAEAAERERAQAERKRALDERRRANAERLRAETERLRADEADTGRAEQARRIAELEARLLELQGGSPSA